MPLIDPTVALSTRQEAFCRHYAVSGNAADAARQAGYSERSTRQTGCALLERPWPGPLAEAVRSRRDRVGHALARHRESREERERQEGFDGAAHIRTAERLAEAVEERERLPVCFGTAAPAPADDLPPADDPPEETYEDDPRGGGDPPGCEDRIDDDRADGAEHDWLYQRRNDYAEIYDPWTPENIELRVRDRLEREEMRCGNDPGNADWTDDPDRQDDDWFDGMEFAPAMTEHDIS